MDGEKRRISMCRRSNVFIIGMLLVGILALAGIGIGIILVQRAPIPGSSGLQATPAFGVTHVLIRNNTYRPDSIEVVVGTVVTWTNEDTVVHSVVFPHVETTQNVVRESGPLSRGDSFAYEFASRGTFEYYCQEHLAMLGIVTVV